jgi:hypothetical protein
MVDWANHGKRCAEHFQKLEHPHLGEVTEKDVGGGRTAINNHQVARFEAGEQFVNLLQFPEVDEFGFPVKTLERRVLVVGIEGAMLDLVIFEILDKVRREEALSDAAFAVNDDVDLFGHRFD